MQVKVNSFMLMYDGKLYKVGDIVDIADEKRAKELVANSGGEFSFYTELVDAEPPADENTKPADAEPSLPDADAAAAVQGKSK